MKYGLKTFLADPSPADVVVTDTLPASLEYVRGPAPIESRNGKNDDGEQVLEWTFKDVMPNEPLGVINFKAKLADDVELGSQVTNSVIAESQGIKRGARVQFLLPKNRFHDTEEIGCNTTAGHHQGSRREQHLDG